MDREIRSDKGHDAFLVEWDKLSLILRGAMDRAVERVDVSA
ncbi:MAG: hypothetical protein ACT4OQ_02935 [Chloroflexota bacterium]